MAQSLFIRAYLVFLVSCRTCYFIEAGIPVAEMMLIYKTTTCNYVFFP